MGYTRTIKLYKPQEVGQVRSGAVPADLNTVTDSTKSWERNEWVDAPVRIVDGTGAGQSSVVTSNGPTFLRISPALTTGLSDDSVFSVGPLVQETLTDVSRCAFELLRLGGCGQGRIVLEREYDMLEGVPSLGDELFIFYDSDDTDPWYRGVVENIRTDMSPMAELTLLGYMGYLRRTYPNTSYGSSSDDNPAITEPSAIMTDLLDNHIVPQGFIQYDAADIVATDPAVTIDLFDMDGNTSLLEAIPRLAEMAGNYSWGVDNRGKFFFKPKPTSVTLTFRAGRKDETYGDIIGLNRQSSLTDVINSLKIRGGVNNNEVQFFSKTDTDSIDLYGKRHATLMVPTILTDTDATTYANEFFDEHASPQEAYRLTVEKLNTIPQPEAGLIAVYSKTRKHVGDFKFEKASVLFDESVRAVFNFGNPEKLALERTGDGAVLRLRSVVEDEVGASAGVIKADQAAAADDTIVRMGASNDGSFSDMLFYDSGNSKVGCVACFAE